MLKNQWHAYYAVIKPVKWRKSIKTLILKHSQVTHISVSEIQLHVKTIYLQYILKCSSKNSYYSSQKSPKAIFTKICNIESQCVSGLKASKCLKATIHTSKENSCCDVKMQGQMMSVMISQAETVDWLILVASLCLIIHFWFHHNKNSQLPSAFPQEVVSTNCWG